jgi:hypothetical protein
MKFDFGTRANILAVLLLLPVLSGSATSRASELRATLAECEACTEFDMRLLASMLGRGDHHVYSIGTNVLRRYRVDRPDPPEPLSGQSPSSRDAVRLAAAAIEFEPLPEARAIFEDMLALDRADPGFFWKQHHYSVPIADIGLGHAPAEIGLARPVPGIPTGAAYNNFMNALRTTVDWFPERIGPALGARESFLARITQISIGTPWGSASLGWRPGTSPAPITVDLRAANGDYVRVRIDASTRPASIEFVGAYSSTGAEFPARHSPSTPEIVFPFDTEIERDRFGGSLGDAGIPTPRVPRGPRPGRWLYITCIYVGGVLSECRIESREE